jgi:DNA-binding MarR family transcriptional regulator
VIDYYDLEKLERMHLQIHKKFISGWNAISPLKLSLPQANMLQMLQKEGMMKVSDLADLLCMSPGGLTILCDKLEEKGLIHRDRDEGDRRIVYLKISEAGEEVNNRITEIKGKLIERTVQGITDEDLRMLKKLYSVVLRNLETIECQKD